MRALRAVFLWALGMTGVFVLMQGVTIPQEMLEETGFPEEHVRLLSIANTGVILALATLIGTLLAHRVGLRSLIVGQKDNSASISTAAFPIFLIAGIILGMVVAFVDGKLMTQVPALSNFAAANADKTAGVAGDMTLAARLLYGGITEEILLRWGLLSLLAWILFKLLRSRGMALASAILISSLLFGLGHLPALGQMFDNVPDLFVWRTIGFNMVLGIVFGIAYVRHNLETAMVAHMGCHLGFLASAQIGLI